MTETAEEEAPATRRRPPGHGPVIGWFRDPARAFATFGLVLGVAIAIVAPPFSGIDEPSHYARAARMAEGSVLPDQPPPGITTPGLDGVGQCLPRPVLHELALYVVENRFPGTPWTEESSKGRFPRCDDADERGFYANATYSWYSPLGYVPQAAAIKVGQILGLSVGTQLFLARLATLATYLALVTVAIRRAPTGRWALAVVALLPVALYEAATSVSPDAFTTAMVIFVLASALRGAARPERVGTVPYLAESIIAAVALGFAKPTYVVFALAYLLPLLRRPWRWASATLALPAVIGGGLSALWYRSQKDSFACDVTLFGITPEPDRQIDSLLHGPQQLIGAAVQAVPGHGRDWVVDTFSVGVTVAPQLAGGAVLVAIALFALAAAQRTRDEEYAPPLPARACLLALGVVGYLGVLGGWLVYCSDPAWEIVNAPHTRLLLPVLPAMAVALAPAGWRATRLNRFIVPVGFGVAAVDLWFVWALAQTTSP